MKSRLLKQLVCKITLIKRSTAQSALSACCVTLGLDNSMHKLAAAEGLHCCCLSHRLGLKFLPSVLFHPAPPVVLALQDGTEQNISHEGPDEDRY